MNAQRNCVGSNDVRKQKTYVVCTIIVDWFHGRPIEEATALKKFKSYIFCCFR